MSEYVQGFMTQRDKKVVQKVQFKNATNVKIHQICMDRKNASRERYFWQREPGLVRRERKLGKRRVNGER